MNRPASQGVPLASDHSNGFSRSRRDTDVHENGTGTATTANSDCHSVSPRIGEAKMIESGAARDRATTSVVDATSLACAV